MILDYPTKLIIDTEDNFYIANSGEDTIIKLSPSGDVLETIGCKKTGYEDGHKTIAKFDYPSAVALDKTGILYVADSANHAIRKVEKSEVSTFAGHPAEKPYLLYSPESLVVDSKNNVIVGDLGKNIIYKITPNGSVYKLAGSKPRYQEKQHSDGVGDNAIFSNVSDIAIDAYDNLYVADTYNFCIRRVTPEGKVTTIRQWFNEPTLVTLDAEFNLYVASSKEGVVYKIDKTNTPQLVAVTCSPSGLALNSKGELFITGNESNGLYRLDNNKKLERIL